MSIPQKIATITANFFVVQASWIPWLLVGFSMGGLAVVLQRALSLILSSARGRTQATTTTKHHLPRRLLHLSNTVQE